MTCSYVESTTCDELGYLAEGICKQNIEGGAGSFLEGGGEGGEGEGEREGDLFTPLGAGHGELGTSQPLRMARRSEETLEKTTRHAVGAPWSMPQKVRDESAANLVTQAAAMHPLW